MATQEFESGLKVETFAAIPAEFDRLGADDRELMAFGLPRRPEDPELLKRWERIVGGEIHYIEPTFVRQEHKRHGPRGRGAVVEGIETSSNWSGAVAFAARGDSVAWIEGEWTVPNPYAPTLDGSLYYSACWIGIDGDGSNDVMQAGIECEASSIFGVTFRHFYAWWEWFPEAEIQIANFPIAAGDVVTCLICATSKTTGVVFFTNRSSGASTSFQITAPKGTQLAGNTAEWIVEAPSVGGSLAKLADYGVVYFDDALAGTSKGAILHGGDGDSINMTDSGGNVISLGTLENEHLVKCTYEG